MARCKLKDRPRTTSGRLSRSRAARSAAEAETLAVALAQPHRAALPKGLRHSRLAESELGRLRLGDRISEREFTAGETYRQLVGAYRRAISAPRGAQSALGSLVADAFADTRLATGSEDARHARLERQYLAAKGRLAALPRGQTIAAVVGRVAVHDAPVGDDIRALKAGLAALAALWQLAPTRLDQPAGTSPGRIRHWRAPAPVEAELLFDDDGS
ncbi:hypothetical protein LGR54_05050 [Ancylobacter sp. Lp-2]|uniref:hypothetical protein n=1 Tax=Ancylobacter sp. Lp-2 TaxID=2881339 RepID=UPI001E4809EF|nr:hypothetical protein [Ancylobacter sp. Lp-2]MCB4767964.1 hypothetical protein [Ancylobacter sp. Lp-2]